MSKSIYGLIGFPLTHSFSQKYFSEKFAAENIDAEYRNFELADIGELMELLGEYPCIRGLNVTIPYKEQAIGYMDSLDAVAAEVRAVNVIKVIDKGADIELHGYNTDVYGFTESIKPLIPSAECKALVMGSGGASKAVAFALTQMGIGYEIVSRSKDRGTLTYADITPEIIRDHLIIVNATPAGMYPDTDSCPDIPYAAITPRHLCYDLVYNPEQTLFLTKAAEQGATTKNGLEMLRLQAEASWRIWTDSTTSAE